MEKRVNQGALLLDFAIPNWHLKIDPEALKMGDCAKCALGQLFGDYNKGEEALFGFLDSPSDWVEASWQYGFILDATLQRGENYESLRMLWVHEIEKRLGVL